MLRLMNVLFITGNYCPHWGTMLNYATRITVPITKGCFSDRVENQLITLTNKRYSIWKSRLIKGRIHSEKGIPSIQLVLIR